jgi:hypothetical protein
MGKSLQEPAIMLALKVHELAVRGSRPFAFQGE